MLLCARIAPLTRISSRVDKRSGEQKKTIHAQLLTSAEGALRSVANPAKRAALQNLQQMPLVRITAL
jgi:hypothetical protein